MSSAPDTSPLRAWAVGSKSSSEVRGRRRPAPPPRRRDPPERAPAATPPSPRPPPGWRHRCATGACPADRRSGRGPRAKRELAAGSAAGGCPRGPGPRRCRPWRGRPTTAMALLLAVVGECRSREPLPVEEARAYATSSTSSSRSARSLTTSVPNPASPTGCAYSSCPRRFRCSRAATSRKGTRARVLAVSDDEGRIRLARCTRDACTVRATERAARTVVPAAAAVRHLSTLPSPSVPAPRRSASRPPCPCRGRKARSPLRRPDAVTELVESLESL